MTADVQAQKRRMEKWIHTFSVSIMIIPTRLLCQMQANSSRAEFISTIHAHVSKFMKRMNFVIACLRPWQNVKLGTFTGSHAVDSKGMYKKAWCSCKVVVLLCQAIAYLTFSSPPHPKLPIIYDTLWSIKNRIFSGQIELLLLIAPKRFFDSSVVPSSLVRTVENKSFPCMHKLGEWTGQVWRDNSRRVRTHEKNSGETVCRLRTIIESTFWCPIRSRSPLEFLEIVQWESVPRGSFTRTWKLSSRLFSRPDWLPLGLRGWSQRCLLNRGFTVISELTGLIRHDLLNNIIDILQLWSFYKNFVSIWSHFTSKCLTSPFHWHPSSLNVQYTIKGSTSRRM